MRRISLIPVTILLILSFTLSIPQTHAAILSGWGTATIDGVVNPSEWANAATIPFSFGGGAYVGTLYIMNDAVNIYVGLVITDTAFDANDGFYTFFDNDNGGETYNEPGDDAIFQFGSFPFNDLFSNGFVWVNDAPPGTNDGQGTGSRVGSTNHFEMSHPLNTADDSHDFSLSISSIVGIHFAVVVDGTTYQTLGTSYFDPSTWAYDYQVLAKRPPISVTSSVVGGIMFPRNNLVILVPYIALAVLIGSIFILLKKKY